MFSRLLFQVIPPGTEDLRWELVDGEPVAMAPPGLNHGAIQNQVGTLLAIHLRTHRPTCRVITTPGVIPQLRARFNERIPDLGVSCGPFTDGRALADPLLLVEILPPPSNGGETGSMRGPMPPFPACKRC